MHKQIIYITMILIPTGTATATLFESRCWSLTYGLACINGSTGENIIEGMKIDASNIIGNITGSTNITYNITNNITTNETKYVKNFTVTDVGSTITHTLCLANDTCYSTAFTDSTGTDNNNYVTAIAFSRNKCDCGNYHPRTRQSSAPAGYKL